MLRYLFVFVACLSALTSAIAQDTTWVNTLNFNDITKRRGTYIFPDGKTYRKINMHYTLKCDPQTTRDNFDCGEWDYLSYVIVHDSTGTIDSNAFEHSNFMIGDQAPTSFDYVNTSFADTFYYYQTERVITNINSIDSTVIGSGTSPSNEALAQTRTQYLYTASELSAAGVMPGDITAISLFVNKTTTSFSNVKISMAQIASTSLKQMVSADFQLVYSGEFNPTLGKNRLQSIEPFTWDGVSNIVVEFARDNQIVTGTIDFDGDNALTDGVKSLGDDSYYKIVDNNFIELTNPKQSLAAVDSSITISFWAKGDDILPKQTSVIEAKDENGNRVLNIHFPWSNGQVYWDAGNASGYDRINKAAGDNIYKNTWNHWAFTKNANTGSMKIYLNGVLWHSGTALNRNIGDIASLRIGKGIDNYQYHGNIDRLSFWKSELSSSEIQDLMTNEISKTQPNFGNLIASFSFENFNNDAVLVSDFDTTVKGQFKGITKVEPYHGTAFFNTVKATNRPKIEFFVSSQDTRLDSTLAYRVVNRPIVFIDEFKDAQDPTLQTGVMAAYEGGFTFSYNPDGSKKDSSAIPGSQTLNQQMRTYYIPFEVINNVEIARYITPYGIGLDLGPNGFRWIYDVTDYAELLSGQVTLSAGNQQELIDLRFEMIEGTPMRDLKEISYYINRESKTYKSIADDASFTAQELSIHPDAKTHKLVTRITGHGHNTDGDPKPHCCEWADKQHYLKIDGKDALDWSIWQDDKCALNPIFDQGGNWAPPRAGWCPGAPVDDYNFDITDYITSDKVTLDYEIEPVPTDNLGQGGGNYVVSMHLMQYGDYNFENDAAVEQIISPNNWEYYLRQNPTCGEPKIQVRNTGKNTITELGLKYGVVGGNPITYYWKETLKSNETAVIDLPFAIWDYLSKETTNTFFAEVFAVNKVADEYADNNRIESKFDIPKMAPKSFTVYFRNNNIADATLQIFDDGGKVVYEQLNAPAGQLVKEDINLNPGCYKLVCETENQFGLFYPLIPQIGSGLLRLINTGAGFVESFNPDFGKSVEYYFTVGYTLETEKLEAEAWKLYPNPSNGLVTLQTNGMSDGNEFVVRASSVSGQEVYHATGYVQGGIVTMDLSNQQPGIYMVELIENNQKTTFKVAIQ